MLISGGETSLLLLKMCWTRILGLVDFNHRKQDAKAAADMESVLLLISEAMEEEEMPAWLEFRQ